MLEVRVMSMVLVVWRDVVGVSNACCAFSECVRHVCCVLCVALMPCLHEYSQNQSDFCCLTDFCKHPTDGHYIVQNRTERLDNSYLKNQTDRLAKSVGHDKNWKGQCSCKRGIRDETTLWVAKLVIRRVEMLPPLLVLNHE
jgi:hypothetical protein